MRLLLPILLLAVLAGCDFDNALPPDDRVEITLLAVYTPAAETAAPDIQARIRAAVEEINDIYRAGNIGVRLKTVHVARVDYQMTERVQDLERLLNPSDGHLDEVHVLRDAHQADLVALVVDRPNATINASIMAIPETAFVIVHYADMAGPGFALAHELGHLQGALHHPESHWQMEPFPYGHGFRGETIRDIMATGPALPRAPRFSGPDQVFEGITLGDDSLRNVARVLRETAVFVSNFRGPRTPTTFVSPGHWPTLPVNPGAAPLPDCHH
jgi:peptidyl-Asp metalloendopeptidase